MGQRVKSHCLLLLEALPLPNNRSLGEDSNRWWTCKCGYKEHEDGTGTGMGRMLGHLGNSGGKATGHDVIGLVDEDTGEVLVAGMNAWGAKNQGYVVGKGGDSRKDRERAARKARDEAEGGSPPAKPSGKRGRPKLDREKQRTRLKSTTSVRIGAHELVYPGDAEAPRSHIPTPIRTVLEGWNLVLPPHIFGLFSVAREVMCDDQGRDYGWEPEGFSAFVWDCVKGYLEFVLPPLLAGASDGNLNEHDALKMLRRIGDMAPQHLVQVVQEAVEEVEGAKVSG